MNDFEHPNSLLRDEYQIHMNSQLAHPSHKSPNMQSIHGVIQIIDANDHMSYSNPNPHYGIPRHATHMSWMTIILVYRTHISP